MASLLRRFDSRLGPSLASPGTPAGESDMGSVECSQATRSFEGARPSQRDMEIGCVQSHKRPHRTRSRIDRFGASSGRPPSEARRKGGPVSAKQHR